MTESEQVRRFPTVWLEDWNGREIEVARSKGGVLALARVRDGLIDAAPWPPASIVQKLYQSRQARSFEIPELELVTRDLGYYCDLQSIHSEDVITYNFFGIVGTNTTQVLNWITDRLGLDGGDTECRISLWRRIPHPDTLVSGGPELDALLVGDRTVLAMEAKWKSSEGKGQGKAGDKTQLGLRNEWFAKYGTLIFGDRTMLVLGISAFEDDMAMPTALEPWIEMRTLTWRDLIDCVVHPYVQEYAAYYRWKVEYSQWPKRRGAPPR